jgi:hypothetical protein
MKPISSGTAGRKSRAVTAAQSEDARIASMKPSAFRVE